jgi:Domain of unknown function (DUF4388)/Response regulator receiver domain
MSFVGNLEDLSLEEILQMIHFSRKSGIVKLNYRDFEASIVFSQGEVISAVSNNIDDTFSDIFLEKGLIGKDKTSELIYAIKSGKTSFQWFMNELNLSPEKREGFVSTLIERIIYSLLAWDRGNFSFELVDDIEQFLKKNEKLLGSVTQGLNPNYILMEGTRRADERKRDETLTATQLEDQDDYETVVDFRARVPEPPQEPTDSEATPQPEQEEKQQTGTDEELPNDSTQPLETTEETSDRAHRLILIDDDPICGKFFMNLSEKRGFHATFYKDNKSFLARLNGHLQEKPKPIIIADLIMPKSDASGLLGGIEILESIREIDEAASVIIIADLFNEEAKKNAEKFGVAAFLDKPKRSKFSKSEHQGEIKEFFNQLFDIVVDIDETLSDEETASTGEAPPSTEPKPAADETADEEYFDIRSELKDEFDSPTEVSGEEESPRLRVLKSMIGELLGPEDGTEITLLILRFAAEIMNRAAIFLTTEREAIGLGQFGMENEGPNAVNIRKVRIPLNGPSIIKQVVGEKLPFKGKLEDNEINNFLVRGLGGEHPHEIYVAPIVSRGRVAAILLGDNLPRHQPIGNTEMLEIFLAQAGMAMEKALLEKLLKESQAHDKTRHRK